ncbi:MAG: TIGR04211 family SH3 domain-containing protein [Gammaproteobacteria bacterium]|nr:TIGR04211 family SH3 domain-containing protein [Gammaproteobacteria bacterium]
MIYQKHLLKIFFLSLILTSTATQSLAQTRYITDQFEVTMRSGTSTSNSIISMLESGQEVTLIEEDVATQYSLVETDNGKQGYVLSRFLVDLPAARDRLARLQVKSDDLQSTIGELQQELDNYRNIKQNDNQQISSLQSNLDRTEKDLADLKLATSDTVSVINQNKNLQIRIGELVEEQKRLSEENARYKDSTAMDWFIRGAAVSLIAFLLGILVTRIRWRKQDSWGSY